MITTKLRDVGIIEDIEIRVRTALGLALYYPANWLFIRPACWLLEMKPIDAMGLHSLVSWHDAERRYSRAGLELMLSFANTYLSDDKLPDGCTPCVFSADGEKRHTNICRHPKAPTKKREVSVFDPIPDYCPLKRCMKNDECQVSPFMCGLPLEKINTECLEELNDDLKRGHCEIDAGEESS